MIKALTCRRGFSLLSTMPFSSLKPSSNRPTSGLNESDVRERPNFVSDKKRRDALVLFEHGLGYSKVAEILEINVNTVRDWAKLYLAGKFKGRFRRSSSATSRNSRPSASACALTAQVGIRSAGP